MFGMSTAQIREKLHKLIDNADESMLNIALDILAERQSGLLTEEQRLDLDRRVEKYKNGESVLYTWPEARKIIEDRNK
jgi:hypothetical protein